MILKKNRSHSIVLLIILILFVLLIVVTKGSRTVAKQLYSDYIFDISERLLSLDIGISSFNNLLEVDVRGAVTYLDYYDKVKLTLETIPSVVEHVIFDKSNVERIDIHIEMSDYLQLLKDRKIALNNEILSSPSKVSALIQYNGSDYDAKIRLKGDLMDHWRSPHRMSLRVKLKDKGTIFGFSTFSIHKPSSRTFPYNHIFQLLMEDTGNLSAKHNFAQVYVNGENWGIMDIEEHVSSEFLEKNKRKESILMRFSDEKKWLYNKKIKGHNEHYRLSDPLLYSKIYNKKKFLSDYSNRKMYSYILAENKNKNLNLYDYDSFSKAYLMSLAWNNIHTLLDSNSKYYFNPYTLKLEPITMDQGYWSKITETENNLNHLDMLTGNFVYMNLLSDEKYIETLYKNIRLLENVKSNVLSYSNRMNKMFPVDKARDHNVIIDNIRKIEGNKDKYLKLTDLRNAYKNKKRDNLLFKIKQSFDFDDFIYIIHYTNGNMELYNLLPYDVIVKKILYNGSNIIDSEILIPGSVNNSAPITIETKYVGIQDTNFTVISEFRNKIKKVKNNISLISDDIHNPLAEDTSNNFDFIEKLSDKKYVIKSGTWSVDKPIIINGSLEILPNTSIQFSKNSYIIIHGKIIANGSEGSPISLVASSDSWKGIYVYGADGRSHMKNVIISDVSALQDGILKLSGALTFYKSDVDIEDVRIENVFSEDAINIIQSSYTLDSIIIDSTFSDGLDSDYSNGKVLNSKFLNIGGDALDFSGSKVFISQVTAIDVRDKAVSAGEGSNIDIFDSMLENVGVGVASKDGSLVSISNSKIFNYQLYGVMSYVKKSFYDKPAVKVNNCFVSDGNSYARQTGTYMNVDGVNIVEYDIDVNKLYSTKIMTK